MYIWNNICIEKRFVIPSNELIYLPHIPSHSTVLIYLQWNLHSEWLRLFLFMRLGLVMSQPSFFTANTNKMKQTHWIPAGLFVIFYWATMVLNSVRVAGRVFMTDSDWAAIICHYCIVFTLCSYRVYTYSGLHSPFDFYHSLYLLCDSIVFSLYLPRDMVVFCIISSVFSGDSWNGEIAPLVFQASVPPLLSLQLFQTQDSLFNRVGWGWKY